MTRTGRAQRSDIQPDRPEYRRVSAVRETPSDYQEGDINTEGRMLDYIVRHEILNSDKTIGGWALNDANAAENGADADITGMALQAMAPYYLDELKYKESGAATPYSEFIKAVERGIYTLHQMQLANGGFKGWEATSIPSRRLR